MITTSGHLWLAGGRSADRLNTAEIQVDCHRRRRGPFSGLAAVLTRIAPDLVRAHPDLVDRHRVAIVTVAPGLAGLVGDPQPTLTTLAEGEERTRYYSPVRAWRISHGMAELLAEYAKRRAAGPLVLAFDMVHEADDTDQEFLAIALRRWPPAVVRLLIGAAGAPGVEALRQALDAYTTKVTVPHGGVASTERDPLRAFILSDGTTDDPKAVAAWRAADPAPRAALHDARADELALDGDFGHRLGAIPFHREHGADPAGAGADALGWALRHCLAHGLYAAAVDLGTRALNLIDPVRDEQRYCLTAVQTGIGLLQLGHAHRARDLFVSLRGRFRRPKLHMSTSYSMAMLYTRLLPEAERDHELARAYAMNAVVIAEATPDPADRAFYTVFQQNGLALVESHRDEMENALALVSAGIDLLARETVDVRFQLHKSVLLHNRAAVYARLGRLAESRADFDAVVELDPNYPDYRLDRGNLLRRLGEDKLALADYDAAIRLGPPFPEAHYNRADVRAAFGDLSGAAEDFRYVLELEPEQLYARINLTDVLTEAGDLEAAVSSADEGLRRFPNNPQLLCGRGVLAMEMGDAELAEGYFDLVLAQSPGFGPALANKAVLAYDADDHATAISLLGEALRQDPDDPDLLFNRGLALQAAERYEEAVADYSRVLDSPAADVTEALRHKETCLALLGRGDADLTVA